MTQDFDQFLDRVGGFGNYQKRQLFFVLTPICFLTCMSLFGMVFQLHSPMTGCKLHPNTTATVPVDVPIKNATVRMTPMEFNEMFYKMMPSSCHLYDYSETDWTFPGSMGTENSTDRTVSCPAGRWWDTSDWEETLVTKLGLICDKAWTVSFLYSIGMFGQLAILPISGYFQDNFGRKNTMFFMLAFYFIFSICVIWAPSWEIVAMLFFAKQGMGSVGFSNSWLIAIEQSSSEWHTFVMIFLCVAFSLSCALAALIAYFTRSFVTFTLVTTIPVLACFLFYPVLDEPARWYLSHKKLDSARKIMESMLQYNNEHDESSIVEDLLVDQSTDNAEKGRNEKNDVGGVQEMKDSSAEDTRTYGIWYIVSSANMVFKTAAIFVTTLAVVLAYYGLMINSENIGVGNMYILLGVGYLVEIPAAVMVQACNYVGRVWITGGSLVVGGIFTACVGTTTDVRIMIFLIIVAKFFCTISFNTIYMFAGEIYPTVIRASGIAAAMLGGAVGGILAPYVIFSLSVHAHLPIFLMAGMSILGGLTCLFLPETMGRDLVDQMEEDDRLKAGFGALKENLAFGHLRRKISKHNSTRSR